jgi:di/tricarboxylate transporter
MASRQPPSFEYASVLTRVDLFAGLDRVTLAKLAAYLEVVSVEAGATVVQQGDPGDAFYLVVKGAFGVYVAASEGDESRVNSLGPGAPFGEMALLTGRPRSASVRAETTAEVLRLERSRFLDLVRREPQVGLALAGTLCERLRRAHVPGDDATEVLTAGPDMRAPSILMPAARPSRRPGLGTLGIVVAAAIMLLVWFTRPPSGLTPAGWWAIGTLVAAVPILALDAVPDGILALGITAAWVLGGVAPVSVALSGFASTSWVLLVSVLALGAAIAGSGLLYRIALWIVANSHGGFAGQVAALTVGGALIGPAVPNATGRVTLIAPALGELVAALGYAPRSSAAAGLAMATLIGFGQMVGVFLTSSTTALLVFAVLPPDTRRDLSWLTWATRAAPTNVILLAGLVAAVIWLYRPRGVERAAYPRPGALALQRALLGPPSRAERLSLAAATGLVLGFVTQPWHRVEPGWIAVLALGTLALTGVVNAETLRSVNWSFVLLFGTLASMSAVFAVARVDSWVAAVVSASVQGLASAPIVFVAALTVLCFAVSLVLRWQAAAPLLTIALAPAAAAAGISPFVVGLVTLIACNGFFLPYQSTTYLALYHGTGGGMFTHRQARLAALAYGLFTLVALCASVPVWRAMGLL